MIKTKLNNNLKSFWDNLSQINVLYGGRLSSKTYDVCSYLLYMSSKYKLRILCLRRFQKNLSESVFSTFKTILDNDEYLSSFFDISANGISSKCGSQFIFYGIERNLTEVKGLDSIDITFFEESELLTKNQYNIIKPTVLRKQGSFLIFVFNPRYDTDFIYKEFVNKSLENLNKKLINYIDNPFLSDSAKSLIDIERKELEEDEFNNIYLGTPLSESSDTLIKRKWISACINAHKILNIEVSGSYFVGYDVADDGNDKNAIVGRHGILVNYIDEWKAEENELVKSTMKVYNYASKNNSKVIYDSIGVGASVGSTINNINFDKSIQLEHVKFNAGAGVNRPKQIYKDKIKNIDMFSNLKAQAWWNISDRIKYTYNAVNGKYDTINEDMIISICSSLKDIDSLMIELSTPRRDFDNSGRVKVESKKDLAKRSIDSPNKADAFIMCLYEPREREIRVIR